MSVYTKGDRAYVRSLTSLNAAFKPYGEMTVTSKRGGERKMNLYSSRVDLDCFSTANAERLYSELPGNQIIEIIAPYVGITS